MRHNTRRILAVMAVATALCADHVALSAPAQRAEQGVEFAAIPARIVSRLARSFRRVVPSALIRRPDRHGWSQDESPAMPVATAFIPSVHQPTNPFQYRLPPPTA